MDTVQVIKKNGPKRLGTKTYVIAEDFISQYVGAKYGVLKYVNHMGTKIYPYVCTSRTEHPPKAFCKDEQRWNHSASAFWLFFI